MAVLYQKYRPQTFAEVKGQEPIVQTLRNAAKAGELAHAYLLTGSRGIGKTTLARLVAKAANCQNLKDGDPCGQCEVCLAVANGNSLDIIEIDAASHTGVDNVRELIDHAQFRPTTLTTKVVIIDEVHMLSKAAFNALLKTLEEPPQHVMFILATTDVEKVPDTIASRTQRFDFKRILPEAMTSALTAIAKDQKLKLADGVVEAIIAQSEGSMRDALSRLDMIASLGANVNLEEAQRLLGITPIESVQELIDKIITHDSSNLSEFFDNTFSAGADPTVFNRSVLQYLRLILNAKLISTSGNSAADSKAHTKSIAGLHTEAQQQTFTKQVSTLALPQLLLIIRLFLRSYKELSSTPLPELPLLLAAIEASLFSAPRQTNSQSLLATNQALAPVTAPAVQPTAQSQADTLVSELVEPVALSDGETLTLEELQVWWPEVIGKVKAANSPVATLLKNSPVIEVVNGNITIAVKYLFHKEHLDNKKHAAIISEAITGVSGKNLSLQAVIRTDLREPALIQTVDALSDALKVFGGELVE